MRVLAGLVLLTTVVIGSMRPAGATTMVPLDLRGLTQRAEVVVEGRVVASTPGWTSAHDAIYTDVTLDVVRVISGPLVAGQQLVIRNEGGSIDGVGMRVHGSPSFTVGEDVVVFVERRGSARYVVGMSQGKLAVTTDATGTKRLARNLGDVAFTRTPTQAEQTLSVGTLDELDAAVKRILAEPKK